MLITSIKEKYNTEIALVVLCCRNYIQTSDSDSIRVFIEQNVIDWGKFYRLSRMHRIAPICYKVLFTFKDIVGQENLEELRKHCIEFNAFALNNKRELNRVMALLKKNHIASKSYKGIDFAENFYGEVGLRMFSDNDIIIRESDIEQLIKVMRKEGYSSIGLEYYLKFPREYIKNYKDIIWEKHNDSGREFAFEFHYKISYRYQGFPYSFAEALGKDYLTAARKYDESDHLKLMTLSNGLMDFYPDIRSVLDLAVIFKKNENINLNNLGTIIKKYLNYGITITNELLNYPNIPEELNPDIKAVKFGQHLLRNILSRKKGKRISLKRSIYFKIKNAESIKQKTIYLKKYILLYIRPNITDITFVNLPYYFLYYFIKPIRLLTKIFRKNTYSAQIK